MTSTAYNIGALIATMGLDTSQYQAGMASVTAAGQAADAATKKASASMTASMMAAGTKMQAIGKKMQRNLTLPLLAIGVASTKVFSDFEASMAKITGLVGVAKSQVDAWIPSVLALGPATGQGPEKLADALFFITSAGIRGSEAMEVLEMAAKGAAAGLGEAKTIADLVTSAMNAYGKENLNAAQATDILTATVREGKAEAADLAAAMGVVIPISSAFNVSFNEVGAAFAAMTRTGTNARVAATQLKAVLSSMASPSQKAEDAMKKFNTSSKQFRDDITNDGLIQALLNLREATNGSKVAMAEIFPNIRGLMATLDLLGSNVEDNVAIFKALEDPTGALETAFLSASDTIKFRFNKALATMKTNMITLGTTLSGSLIPMLEKVTGFIAKSTEKWNELSEAQRKNRIRIAGLAAAAGPLLIVMGKITKLLATPLGPYGLAIAGALAFTLAIRKLIMKHREEKETYDAVATANNKVATLYETQAGKIAYLTAIIEDENISQQGRIAAINEMKSIMPGYNAALTEEGKLIGHNKTAIEDYLAALKDKIKLQVFESEYVAVLKEQVQAQRDLDKAITEARVAQEKFDKAGGKKEQYTAGVGGGVQKQMSVEYAAVQLANEELARRQSTLASVTKAQADLTEEMKRTGLVIPGAAPAVGGGGGGGGGEDPIPGDDGTAFAEKQAQARLDLARMIADEELELYTNAFQKKAAAEQLSYERSKAALQQSGKDGVLTEGEVNRGIEALENAHQQRMIKIAQDGATATAKALADGEAEKQKIAEEARRAREQAAAEEAQAEADARDYKLSNLMSYMNSASGVIMGLADLTERSKQKELKAAGDNKEAIARIEQEYFKKQKKFAIGQAIINGALAITNMIANIPGSVINPATWVGIGVAAATTATQVAMIGAQNFAQGGIAYGEVIGRMGEYPGARQNPEVIAPLNRLKDLLGTGSGGTKMVEMRLRGRDAVAIVDMERMMENTY